MRLSNVTNTSCRTIRCVAASSTSRSCGEGAVTASPLPLLKMSECHAVGADSTPRSSVTSAERDARASHISRRDVPVSGALCNSHCFMQRSSSAVSTYVSREDNTKYAERRTACATLEYWCRSCTADDRPRPIVRCLQVALGWSLWSGDTDSSRKCRRSGARVAAAIASGYEADATSHPPLFKRSVPQALPRACLRERSARS